MDIVFISRQIAFVWKDIMADAVHKDMWVDPVSVAHILDTFPLHHLDDIAWIVPSPSPHCFREQLASVIRDILRGSPNSLHPHREKEDSGSSPG